MPCYLGQGNNKADFLVSYCYNSKIARSFKTSIPDYVFQNALTMFISVFFSQQNCGMAKNVVLLNGQNAVHFYSHF